MLVCDKRYTFGEKEWVSIGQVSKIDGSFDGRDFGIHVSHVIVQWLKTHSYCSKQTFLLS